MIIRSLRWKIGNDLSRSGWFHSGGGGWHHLQCCIAGRCNYVVMGVVGDWRLCFWVLASLLLLLAAAQCRCRTMQKNRIIATFF
jgi:hypothetical protein